MLRQLRHPASSVAMQHQFQLAKIGNGERLVRGEQTMPLNRTKEGRFARGWVGGGRPLGSRNRLTEVALQALGEHFAEHGAAAIDRVYREEPATYLKIVASLLPRQVMVEKVNPMSEMTDEEIEALEQHLAAVQARLVQQIEPVAEPVLVSAEHIQKSTDIGMGKPDASEP
jgi:hypothetical protein